MNNSRIQLFDDLDYEWYDFNFVAINLRIWTTDHEI